MHYKIACKLLQHYYGTQDSCNDTASHRHTQCKHCDMVPGTHMQQQGQVCVGHCLLARRTCASFHCKQKQYNPIMSLKQTLFLRQLAQMVLEVNTSQTELVCGVMVNCRPAAQLGGDCHLLQDQHSYVEKPPTVGTPCQNKTTHRFISMPAWSTKNAKRLHPTAFQPLCSSQSTEQRRNKSRDGFYCIDQASTISSCCSCGFSMPGMLASLCRSACTTCRPWLRQ